jgi:hypothetical protein
VLNGCILSESGSKPEANGEHSGAVTYRVIRVQKGLDLIGGVDFRSQTLNWDVVVRKLMGICEIVKKF